MAVEPRALKDVDDWWGPYRRFFDESFDLVDLYLKKLQAKEPKAKLRKKESRHGRGK